jgi:hypothetical protein
MASANIGTIRAAQEAHWPEFRPTFRAGICLRKGLFA